MGWPTKEQRAAKAAKEQAGMPETESPPLQPTVDVSAIMARLEALEAENAALKAKTPQFVPMKRQERPPEGGYVPPEELRKRDMKGLRANGQMVGRQVSSYDDPEKYANLPAQFRPAFSPGMSVMLNPEAAVWGKDGEVWGQVLNNGQPVVGIVGEVLRMQGRTRSFEPKYRVHFPGLTRVVGSGFRESELVYA